MRVGVRAGVGARARARAKEGEGQGLRANQQGKTVVTHRQALALSAADTLIRNGAPGSRQSALRVHVSNLYLVFAFT